MLPFHELHVYTHRGKTNNSLVSASAGRSEPIKTTDKKNQLVAPLWKLLVSIVAPIPATTAHPSGLHCCSSCLFLIQTKLPITIIGTTQINCCSSGEALLTELWVNWWTHATCRLCITL